jgi:hypothetical protein
MTTAPTTTDFAKTVNAVGIGSSAWLERPALNLNKIKALASLKINENSSLQETAFLSYYNHRRPSKPPMKNKNMTTIYTVTECKMERDLGTDFAEAYAEKEHRFATKEEMMSKFEALKSAGESEQFNRGSRRLKLATNLATYRHEFDDGEEAAEYLEIGGHKLANQAKETNMICWEAE